MEHVVESLSSVKRKISLTVSAQEVNTILDTAVRRYGANVTLPGFRKGKAPAKVLEARFHDEIVSNATDNLVNNHVTSVLTKENLNPITRIEYEAGSDSGLERDKDFSFAFSFEVLPEISLPDDLSALSVEVESPDLKPEELEQLTHRIRQSMATLEEVTENRLPQEGDVVLVDVDGSFEGKPVPGMKAENFLVQIHASDSPLEVDAIIRTLHAGEENTGMVTCPADFPDVSLRGKPIEMKVKVHKVHTEVLPEMDDELAKKSGFADIGQMRRAIFEQSMRNKMIEVRGDAQQKLLDSLLENLDFPLPESMVTMHTQAYMSEARRHLQEQGLDEEAVEAALANVTEEANTQAKAQAKAQAFLAALAFREKVRVTEKELEQQVQRIAKENRQDPAKLNETLWRTGMIDSIRDRMLSAKTMDYLFNKAQRILLGPDGQPLPQEQAVPTVAPINPFASSADEAKPENAE